MLHVGLLGLGRHLGRQAGHGIVVEVLEDGQFGVHLLRVRVRVSSGCTYYMGCTYYIWGAPARAPRAVLRGAVGGEVTKAMLGRGALSGEGGAAKNELSV